MPDGVPGDIDARLNELKNAIYYLSELVQRTAAPPGLEKVDALATRVDELGARVDKLADSLGWVARQSSELSTLLKAVEAKTSALPTREDFAGVAKRLEGVPKPEQVQAVAERVDKLADSLGWVARQSSELSTAVGALNQKLDGLPTRDQFAQWARSVTTSTDASAAEVVSKVDAVRDQLKSLDRLATSFDSISKQNLLMSQNLDALTKRTAEVGARMDAIPTREQMGQFASMVEGRLAEVSESVSKDLAQQLGQTTQKVEQRLGEAVGQLREASAGMDAKLDATAQRVDARLGQALEELEAVSGKVDSKMDATAQRVEQKLAESSQRADQQISSAMGELRQIGQSVDARLAPLAAFEKDLAHFTEEYAKTSSSLQEVHDQFEFQKKQAEALAEALTVIHRDLNHESEMLGDLDKKTIALGEALATVGAAATDSAAKLSSLESASSQSTQRLEQVTAQLQAVFPKLESLAQNTASANAALSARADSIAGRLEEQRKAFEPVAAQLTKVYSSTAQAHQELAASLAGVTGQLEKSVGQIASASQQAAASLGEKLELAVRELGERTQSFEQTLKDLSARLDRVEGLTSLTEKEEGEVIAAIRDMSAQMETHRKQGEIFASSLDSLEQELAATRERYTELKDALEAVPSAEQLETAEKRTEAALEKYLSAQSQQLSAASEGLAQLRKDLEDERRDTRLVVEALTSLVKEVSHMEAELSKQKVEPSKLYEEMERRFLSRLSEKLASGRE